MVLLAWHVDSLFSWKLGILAPSRGGQRASTRARCLDMNQPSGPSLSTCAPADPAPSTEIAFLTRYLVQATLPHRQPKGRPPEWHRKNGKYTLSVRPGFATDRRTRVRRQLPYPSGTIPRLLMFWITTEAVRTKERRLSLGASLSEFMRELGLNPRNGGRGTSRSDARRLYDQMERLFRATISFEYSDWAAHKWCDMQVAGEGEFWWNPVRPDEPVLWDSWVLLGERFFDAIVGSPVPVDLAALRQLKGSSLALDLYAWATYKTDQACKRRSGTRVSWRQLHAQLGADYSNPKDFKRRAKCALSKVRSVYPGLRLGDVPGGLVVYPGKRAVRALRSRR